MSDGQLLRTEGSLAKKVQDEVSRIDFEGEAPAPVSLIKHDTGQIKNINDLFGMVKKTERALEALERAVLADDMDAINEVLEGSVYKGENLFDHFVVSEDSQTVNIHKEILPSLAHKDPGALHAQIRRYQEINKVLLGSVKAKLLGRSTALGIGLSNLERVKQDISSTNSAGESELISDEALKAKFKKLLG